MSVVNSRTPTLRHRWRKPKHHKQPAPASFDTQKLCEAAFPGCNETIISSPEILTWKTFLEREIGILWESYFLPVLPFLGYTQGSIDDALEIFIKVSTLLQVAFSSDTSIDSISIALFEHHKIEQQERRSAGRHEVRQLIFAVIGLLTMLYTPSPTVTSGLFTIALPTERNSGYTQQSCEKAQNQIFRFLRGFGDLVPLSNQTESDEGMEVDQEISVSKLNYSTLQNIGDIHISWVETVGEHLSFNEKTRVLSLFCLPSFCLLQKSIPDNRSLFHKVLQSFYRTPFYISGEDQRSKAFFNEMFLSYRILFGLDKSGRRAFKSEQRKISQSSALSDPVLEQLCAKARVDEILHLGDQVFQGGVYMKNQNFPIFGDRMVALQSYSARQSPGKFWAFWRDRRKPADFLNLWVVIFFGATSLILSLSQLIVAAASLYVSSRQLQQC